MGKARYAYFVQVTDTRHKQVSAKEFKELSHHWEAEKEVNGIMIYTSAEIECGRRCRKRPNGYTGEKRIIWKQKEIKICKKLQIIQKINLIQ